MKATTQNFFSSHTTLGSFRFFARLLEHILATIFLPQVLFYCLTTRMNLPRNDWSLHASDLASCFDFQRWTCRELLYQCLRPDSFFGRERFDPTRSVDYRHKFVCCHA